MSGPKGRGGEESAPMTTQHREQQTTRPTPVAPDGYGDSDHADADATGVDLPVVPPA